MLDVDGLGRVLDGARAELFRLETLDSYEVASDGSDYRRYLDGEHRWTEARKAPWLQRLAAEEASGFRRYRVHVVDTTHGLAPYLRYEIEWGYLPNVAAGEEVRVLDVATAPDARGLRDVGDFWLVDDRDAVRMHYAADGTFVGAEVLDGDDARRCREARDATWARGADVVSWWDGHPRYHRTVSAG